MVAYETISLEAGYAHRLCVPSRNEAGCSKLPPSHPHGNDASFATRLAWRSSETPRTQWHCAPTLSREKQRLILEEHELKIQLRQQLTLQQPAVVAMDVNMSYFLTHSSTRKFH
jgi:hypothetical protein